MTLDELEMQAGELIAKAILFLNDDDLEKFFDTVKGLVPW